MVQGAARPDSGSSSREYGITLECQPPAAARPAVPFTLPVIVAVRAVGTSRGDPVQQLGVSVSLRNEAGNAPCAGLTGTLTATVCSRRGNTMSGFGSFRGLTISQPGRYRLRVMLAAALEGGVATRAYVDSDVIVVHSGAPRAQRPSPTQVATFQRLVQENIGISAADIAAWQQANVSD
ncbi:uncharacterized protein BDW43DRAFT_313551 [Aspergillus alliaceus]|uniref:uncharacterized protein n=1 Tax=Petromyces alliaceus TaxID=209559 RepID=UPI0012A6B76C|nr:uncharacterized protein BDW43DRAFT_313551 [Aspergillus alliaceus]KAB8230981.1 hypothetical protein BDW43DRAFT_313551 [Aspergillus alliaceus]